MGWLVSILVAAAALIYFFLQDAAAAGDGTERNLASGGIETQQAEAVQFDTLANGWSSSGGLAGLTGGDIEPTTESSFMWRNWGVIISELGPGDYQLNIDYNGHPPRGITSSRTIHSGPLLPMTNCTGNHVDWCAMMNELFKDIKSGLEAGVIVPNKL